MFAAYSSRTERAARAYLAKRAAETKAIEDASKTIAEPEPERDPIERLAIEAVRQFDQTKTVSEDIQAHNIPVKAIIRAVCEGTGITLKDVLGEGRTFPVKEVRHKAMCVAALAKRQSLILLAREFKRDHTTILSALEKHGVHREPIRKKREITEDDLRKIHEMRNRGVGRHKIAKTMQMGTLRVDQILSGKVGVTSTSRVVELFRQGHDTFDIAKIMGLSEAQVCERLHQSRERERHNRAKRAA